MPSLARQLVKTASRSCAFLDATSRREVAEFLRSAMNPDGGFRGRDGQSDLYYTLFAVAGLRALRRHVPVLSLWKYLRVFGTGEQLDLVHFVCFFQLRAFFPMLRSTRQALSKALAAYPVDSTYSGFIKLFAGECTPGDGGPVAVSAPTPVVAAAVLTGGAHNGAAELLLARHCEGGGFCANPEVRQPDLLSTAVALYALRAMQADVDAIREPCLGFVESLWRPGGGFAGHAADAFEDTEYTFYGLLSLGCLLE